MGNVFLKNCCDGIYNSFDVHFTSACDNKCMYCIDNKYKGLNICKPNIEAISNIIIKNKEGYEDVLFLGGEPCLYLQKLIDCINLIKKDSKLKIFVTTSVPKICHDKKESFKELIRLVDGINISAQHYREVVADEMRGVKSKYDRQDFYNNLPYKNKIRINLNIVKPHLYIKEDIKECLMHYDKMKFNSIKITEIQHTENQFVSFEKIFNIKLPSPFYGGCQKYLNMNDIIPNFKTPVLLKRSCFVCEESLKASFQDGVKIIYKLFKKSSNKYGVVYEDGTIKRRWI